MSGNKIVLDTNIVLYLLNGDKTIAQTLEGLTVYLSFVTELELMGYPGLSQVEKKHVSNFLTDCIIIDINATLKQHVIALKQKHNLKLPDAIIAGTAIFLDLPLFSADKGFRKVKEAEILFYES